MSTPRPINFISRFKFMCEPWHYAGVRGGTEIELRFEAEANGEIFKTSQILRRSDDESLIDVVFDSAKRSLIEAMRKSRKEAK